MTTATQRPVVVLGTMFSVADGGEGHDAPPQGVAHRGELGVDRVLRVVSDQGADHDDPARHQGDPAQPLEQAARSPGRHHQPGETGQAEQDHELAPLGAGEQEPRGGGDHYEQVKAAQSGAPVMLEMASVHHVVDQEHQPGDHADHHADPAIGLGNNYQRQDRRHHDRHSHPPAEALQKGGIALRARLTRRGAGAEAASTIPIVPDWPGPARGSAETSRGWHEAGAKPTRRVPVRRIRSR